MGTQPVSKRAQRKWQTVEEAKKAEEAKKEAGTFKPNKIPPDETAVAAAKRQAGIDDEAARKKAVRDGVIKGSKLLTAMIKDTD